MITLRDLNTNIYHLTDEITSYAAFIQGVLERMKIVIGNDLAACKRDKCAVDKPCVVCKSLRQLDSEIDSLLK